MAVDSTGNVYLCDSGAYVREAMPVGPGGLPPVIASSGIVGAGGSNPPVQAVSTGAMVSIFGSNFAPSGSPRVVQADDLVSGSLPTNLSGICVSFGRVNAPVTGVFPNQINVQTPSLPPGPATVQVTANCGGPMPMPGNVGAVTVDEASPEFFSSRDAGSGLNFIAASNVTGGAIFPGSLVEAYGTGWGTTRPAIAAGNVPGAPAPLAAHVSLRLGSVHLSDAGILYAGMSPCCAGLYQLDFIVPADTPSGNLPLVITVNGVSSPSNAYINVGGSPPSAGLNAFAALQRVTPRDLKHSRPPSWPGRSH
jgi:uncharacterized protein (TIGR03437 family)